MTPTRPGGLSPLASERSTLQNDLTSLSLVHVLSQRRDEPLDCSTANIASERQSATIPLSQTDRELQDEPSLRSCLADDGMLIMDGCCSLHLVDETLFERSRRECRSTACNCL